MKLIAIAAFLGTALPVAAETRVAVVIGNADYGSDVANLKSPLRDAEAMRAVFQDELGFDKVIFKTDADRRTMIDALQEAKRAAGDGVVVFYYSGHGIQVDGESYLIPARVRLKSIDDVALEAIGVRQALSLLSSAKLRIFMLDACRNNPFGLGGKSLGAPGLARDKIDGLSGTLVSYSAAPGTISYDGDGGLSPFTSALVRRIVEPGLDLPNVFMSVRGDLERATAKAPRGPQRSEEVSSLTHDHRFSFVTTANVSATSATKGPAATTAIHASPASPAPRRAAPDKRGIAVMPLLPASKDDAATANLVTDALAQAVGTVAKERVVSAREVQSLIGVQAEQQLLGCDTPRCTVDLSKTLDVDTIVVGRIGVALGRVLVFLSLIDVNTQSVIARASHSFSRAALGAQHRESTPPVVVAAQKLFQPEAAKSGQELLGDLRVALVFSEHDAKGPLDLRRVEACIEEQLLRVDTKLVSAEQVAVIKQKTDIDALLAGRLPDLTTEDVDVVLAGRVQYTPIREFSGTTTYNADLTLRLIKVDTAQIVASKQLAQMGNGFAAHLATNAAANKICEQVKPALEAALQQRQDRGHTVTLSVSGANLDAADIGKTLETLKGVVRTRVRKFDKSKSLIDVTVRGGDGVALAIDMRQAGLPFDVTSAESGKIEAVPR